VLAGPFACQLAHMGADVIKVEARDSGDLARQLGADLELNKANMGVSFLAQGRVPDAALMSAVTMARRRPASPSPAWPPPAAWA